MGILDEDIQRVRESSDIVAVVTEHLQLKRVGSRWSGLCPFHNEKSPSFSVNAEAGLYYCFGCGAKGDVITFVREIEHLDFAAAVEKLAARAGITLRYTSRQEGEGRSRRGKLVEAMEAAVAWYHERLLSSPDAAEARKYLRSRGLDGDVVRHYRIGWAPDDWDQLVRGVGVPFDTLREVNLALLNRRNRRQDVFRARVLFPIFDSQGAPVAFGGRVLPGGEGPKYRNSSETPIYSKSKVLYGLNWAKAAIVETDEAIVCEGYTDVIGMAQAGMPRAVAPCGTALTEEHVRLLTRFGHRIVLAFDADAAGANAAARFYEWETTFDVDVRVAALPSGQDPGDLARSDPAALRAAVEGSVPFLRFRFERALAGADVTTPEGKARTADAVLPIIAEHPKDLVRDEYVMELADRLRIEDPNRLREALRSVKAGRRRPTEAPTTRREPVRTDPRELEALRLLVHHRDQIAGQLDVVLFAEGPARAAYVALAAAPGVAEAIEAGPPPEAAELLARLAQEEAGEGPTALDVVARLVKEGVLRRRAEARRDEDFALVHELNRLADRIQPPDVDAEAVARGRELLREAGRGSGDDGGHEQRAGDE